MEPHQGVPAISSAPSRSAGAAAAAPPGDGPHAGLLDADAATGAAAAAVSDADWAARFARGLRDREFPELFVGAAAPSSIVELSLRVMDQATPVQADLVEYLGRQLAAGGVGDGRILGHLALARAQRIAGQPAQALAHLFHLRGVAGAEWQPWLEWEAVLAGGAVFGSAGPRGSSAEGLRVDRALALIAAASQGDASAFEREAHELVALSPKWPALSREAQALPALLHPDYENDDPEVSAWRHGSTQRAPFGIRPRAPLLAAPKVEASVLVVPGSPARRFLSVGQPLLGSVRSLASDEDATGSSLRTESGISVLALASEGLSYPSFVRAVYGLAYSPKRHQGMLDVLVHRMRARLGASAQIHRVEGTSLILVPSERFIVPDGRTLIDMQQRLLDVLATAGAASAQEVASALDIPRRTAHRLLQTLVQSKTCGAARLGTRVRYQISEAPAS